MLLHQIEKDCAIHPPKWLSDNTCYLTIMGSEAYGVADQAVLKSDKDVYGFCLPPIEYVFPHLSGNIYGFDSFPEFHQWQEHHIEWNKKEYDFSVYNIVRYFYLCMDNNPNMLDSLFTSDDCVLHNSNIAQMVRDKRKIFLSKKAYHKFRGYYYSQINKAKSTERTGKRKEIYEIWGYDLKFASHALRLLYECEQILVEHDLDLRRHKEEIKAVRRGDMTFEQVKEFAASKEVYLEELYQKSTLRYEPDKAGIKELLLNCLEHHYGSLDKMVYRQSQSDVVLQQIRELLR